MRGVLRVTAYVQSRAPPKKYTQDGWDLRLGTSGAMAERIEMGSTGWQDLQSEAIPSTPSLRLLLRLPEPGDKILTFSPELRLWGGWY